MISFSSATAPTSSAIRLLAILKVEAGGKRRSARTPPIVVIVPFAGSNDTIVPTAPCSENRARRSSRPTRAGSARTPPGPTVSAAVAAVASPADTCRRCGRSRSFIVIPVISRKPGAPVADAVTAFTVHLRPRSCRIRVDDPRPSSLFPLPSSPSLLP